MSFFANWRTIMSKLLTKKQVLLIVPYCNTHLLRMEKASKFPKRLKPEGKPKSKAFWVEKEVLDWVKEQMDRRYDTDGSS